MENLFHQRNLKRIPIRILVNGTRGKTSVCRILHKVLNDNGIRTLGRTTGSEAVILYPDGSFKNIIRKRNARILEMIPFIRLAVSDKVQCIVTECMAVQPENQAVMARYLIRPTHVLITNSYVDHVAEMGWNKNDVIWALSKSIPSNAMVYATDVEYNGCGSRFTHVDVKDFNVSESSIPVHNENICLCTTFLANFEIKEEAVIRALPNVTPDKGLAKNFCNLHGAVFIPSFAVNDLTCMKRSLIEESKFGRNLYLVFNNRRDREYRILLFAQAVSEYLSESNTNCKGDSGVGIKGIFCIGDYPKKVASYIQRKTGVNSKSASVSEVFDFFCSADAPLTMLALGNIKGDGERLLDKLSEKDLGMKDLEES